MTYRAPVSDIAFALKHAAGFRQALDDGIYGDLTEDVVDAVLEEAGKFATDVISPLNVVGDRQGVIFKDGAVATAPGWKEAYRAWAAAGWNGLAAPAEWGGQDLPQAINVACLEMWNSAAMAYGIGPVLTMAGVDALTAHGSEELQRAYLPKLVSGEWTGTMQMTEPQAGSDVGALRTKAERAADGTYRLTGQKIFITYGEHDMTDNIVHIVLARLPDAPAGTKGISLFLVPKRLPTDEGAAGLPNGVSCGSIEHKMGIKANATCVMNFENARGWLVGEPHKGMRAMFTMMNGARLGVGMQGLGLAEVSYQNAVAYAKERLQGRSPRGPALPNADADPIVVHPDVRRMLLTMRAYIEGMRALAYWVGTLIDIEERHQDAARRKEATDLVALMTPVIKAFCTDVGFEITNLALQCLGGHGYIREYGMEQFVRDARIAQIYEGTNGVQAMDLLGRKVPDGNGRMVRRFVGLVERDLGIAADRPALAAIAGRVRDALALLARATETVMKRAATNPDEIGSAAADYLRLFGLVASGWMWLRMATVAEGHAADGGAASSKLATAEFFATKILPDTQALGARIDAGAGPVMAVAF
jgi:3-(methylsulfanyl)propanoyl-CoA dehydrogenase